LPARLILAEAVQAPERSGGLARALHDRFQELGGVELDIPPRTGTSRRIDSD